MNSTKTLPADRASVLILAGAVCFVTGLSAGAQGVEHLRITQPGGQPGLPVITGVERVTNGVRVTWDGPSGYYQLFQKPGAKDAHWQPVGGPTNLVRQATITAIHSNAFFRVSGPAPHYAGAQVCLECHENIHRMEMDTRHAGAFSNALFVAKGGQTNNACLPCHTVGYGLPTGFSSVSDLRSVTRLAGVQCESCHGPAANHAANDNDPTVRPRVEVAATVCGGCHTGSHQPTFDEWKISGHAEVTEPNMNPNSCGRCHIAPARIAMLKGDPVPQNDSNVGVVCVTCHDPHRQWVHPNVLHGLLSFTNVLTGGRFVITNAQLGTLYTNQLRNPVSSTKDYFLSTSDVFTNKYDPSINVCAQCHNHRDARYTTSSRAPHHSPQYNLLLGSVGELATASLTGTNNLPAAHALLEKQCVGCHMPTEEYVSEVQPAVTGHKFSVESYETCAGCHGSAANAQDLVALVQSFVIAPRIQELKNRLDEWALTKGPAVLQSTNNYGRRAWEYTNPGDLSPGGPGPNAAEQALLPQNIWKARFNLYLVLYDGSYGVHNAPLSITLLDTALNWVRAELNP